MNYNIKNWGARALSVVVMSSIFAAGAWAQDAAKSVAPAAVKAAPAAKAVPAAPAAAKAAVAAPAATAPAAAKPKVVAKKAAAPSPCQGLDEKTCGGNKACDWIVPKDANDKTGKVQEPYCRKVAGVAKKAAAAKAAVKPAAAPAATAAPAAKAAVKAAAPAPAAPAVKPPAPAGAQ